MARVNHPSGNDASAEGRLAAPRDEITSFPYAQAIDPVIERWCQLGAAEFMLTRASVRELIKRDGFSVKLIPTLMAELGISLVASEIQPAICAPVNCYVLMCQDVAAIGI